MEREESLIFKGLNDAQYQAVANIEGAALIIAGAGSGKTRVLTCRIANILDKGYAPDSVLALTFTRKAAKEMKDRITQLVGYEKTRYLYMGTFHSVFIRFLKEYAELLGYPKDFTIYDTSDSKSVIREIVAQLQLNDKTYSPKIVLGAISRAKNNLYTAAAYEKNVEFMQNDIRAQRGQLWQVYKLYEKKCKAAGAMDYDDILLNTNILLKQFPNVLEALSSRFKFILVDEYQDTNYAQYIIIKKLSSKYRNIAVVGDDSQSIYSFRGARVENILRFKEDFPESNVYKLEQNYRSTDVIVNAANSLIEHNENRLQKKCFSNNSGGELIEILSAFSEREESYNVASSIFSLMRREGADYKDFAILYRTNSQSRVMEEALRKKNMPYIIYAGHSFYEREEIKNMMAYLKFVLNPKDNESFKRIIKFPSKGIGATTYQKLKDVADAENVSIGEVILNPELIAKTELKQAAVCKLLALMNSVLSLQKMVPVNNAFEMLNEVNTAFKITESLKLDASAEGKSRLDNVEELFSSAKEFVAEGEEEYELQDYESSGEEMPIVTLDLFVENIALLSDTDERNTDEDKNKISLMTVHSSKGLEFPYVYIIGMEENLFPINDDFGGNIEEERRLFYVAVTRGGKVVKLSYANLRTKFGTTVSNKPSRFLSEIDSTYLKNPLVRESEKSSGSLLDRAFTFKSATERRPAKLTPIKKSLQGNSNSTTELNNVLNKNTDYSTIKKGDIVEHSKFGRGVILQLDGDLVDRRGVIKFDNFGNKVMLLKYAKLKVVK